MNTITYIALIGSLSIGRSSLAGSEVPSDATYVESSDVIKVVAKSEVGNGHFIVQAAIECDVHVYSFIVRFMRWLSTSVLCRSNMITIRSEKEDPPTRFVALS